MDDVARRRRFRPQLLDQRRHNRRRGRSRCPGCRACRRRSGLLPRASRRTSLFGKSPSGKRRKASWSGGRAVEEIALVAGRIAALPQLDPALALDPADIMAGRQAIGAKVAGESRSGRRTSRPGCTRAGHRRPPGRIFVGELVDHAGAEAAFIVEHIMGDAEPVADGLGVVNVLAGAAATRCASPPRHGRRAAA